MSGKARKTKEAGKKGEKSLKGVEKGSGEGCKNVPDICHGPNPTRFWNHFRVLFGTKAILRGSFSMHSKHFKFTSRGKQSSASCVAAVVFGQLVDPKNWTRISVDSILECGDKLCKLSQIRNRVKEGVYMTPNQVYPKFYFGDYKCEVCVESGSVFGNLQSDNIGSPSLDSGLRKFFETNVSGILTSQGVSVAVWRHPRAGYLFFDPGRSDEEGKRNNDGVACIVRSKDLDDLLQMYKGNLNQLFDSRYCLDKVSILRVKLVGRGKIPRPRKEGLVVEKKVLRSINPADVKGNKDDCTQPVPAGPNVPAVTTKEYNKIPLNITISNYDIQSKFATEPLVNQHSFDTGYAYDELRANVPESFHVLNMNVAILHGWTHQASEMYKAKGAQTVPNCFMALGMKRIHPVKTWLRTKLDEILTLGDELYANVKAEKPNVKVISSIDLHGVEFKVNGSLMVFDVDLLTIFGTIFSKNTSVLNVAQGLNEFFLKNTDGIIESPSITLAIWSESPFFYMFDPRSSDATGMRSVDDKGKGKKEPVSTEKKVKGKCCTIRFTDMQSLSIHIQKNIDQAAKGDRFTIRRITIFDYIPGTRPWNEFKPGEAGKSWILPGEMSSISESIEEQLRGIQSLAIPVVALIMAKKEPSKWDTDDVNDVIKEGTSFYNWCFPPGDEEHVEPKVQKLDTSNVKKRLYVKNRRITIEIVDSAIVGNLQSVSDKDLPNLEKGVTQFFENYQFGVVEAKETFIAVWAFQEELRDKSIEQAYYMFDPNPKEHISQFLQTETDQKESVACVIRFLNIPDLVQTVKETFEKTEGISDEFWIHSIKTLTTGEPMTEDEIEADKDIPLKPDLFAYSALGENGACLQGTITQNNDTVFRNKKVRNKQQAANALVALAMTSLFNPYRWNRDVVDDILKIGDKITQDNLTNIPDFDSDENEHNAGSRDYLIPADIPEEFFIGTNRIHTSLEENTNLGKTFDLAKNLDEFFKDNSMGIYKQDQVMLPIWKEGTAYFAMDPRGRNAEGLGDESGNAAVMWFTDVTSLANSMQSAIGVEPETSDFAIDGVNLENDVPKNEMVEQYEPTEDASPDGAWHNFQSVAEGVWEIEGSVSLSDERFPEENRAKQCAAVVSIAIIFSKIYEPRLWTAEIFDEVTVTGDKLHSKCTFRLGEGHEIRRINDLMKEFFISNRRVVLSFKDCVQSGTLRGKPPKVKSLQLGLEKFYGSYISGCIHTPSRNIATWTHEQFYYCVLPGERLLRFKDLGTFANHFLQSSDEDFEIIAVDVLDMAPPGKYDPSAAVRPSNLPSLNAFRRLPGARAILQGFINQASSIFSDVVRGQQTTPNCIVAVAMSVIKSPTTWTRKTMDEVLAIGCVVLRESWKVTPSRNLLKLKVNEVVRAFRIGVNVVTSDIEENTVKGLVALRPVEPDPKNAKRSKGSKASKSSKKSGSKKGKTQREPPPQSPPIMLETGLPQFFEKNNAGILTTGRYTVAVWRDSGVYFLYDPQARDSEGLRNKENTGLSSLMWFACLEPLYDVVMHNIDDMEKYSSYHIHRIIVRTVQIEPLPLSAGFRPVVECADTPIPLSDVDKVPTLDVEPVTDYIIVDDKLSILRGSSHLEDFKFSRKTRGLQSTAIAAVAIVVGLVHVPSTWTPALIDAILKYGNDLHTDSTRLNRPGGRTLSPSELLTVFIVGDFRVSINIQRYTVAGVLIEYDLAESLRLFFKNNCSGILHTMNMAVAVMQHCGKYYLFEPCSRDTAGKPNITGAACLMKCETIEKLASIFVANCQYKQPTIYTLNAVNILNLYFFSQ